MVVLLGLASLTVTIGFLCGCSLLCCTAVCIMLTVACKECAYIIWRVIFRITLIIGGNVLCCLFMIPIIVIVLIVLLISYFMFISGSSGFELISTLGFTINIFFSGAVAVLNPISLLYPAIMTFVNLLLKILFLIAEGFFFFFCPGAILTDDGFNAFSDCPVLVLFIPNAEALTSLIMITIEIGRIILGLIALALFPTICLRDITCEKMCLDLGLGLGCTYNFGNAMKWLFKLSIIGVPVNMIEFVINLYDLINGFWLLPLLQWIFNNAHVSALASEITLYAIFVKIVLTNGEVLTKVIMGLIIQYIIVILDWLYCSLFTSNLGPCFVRNICLVLLGPIPWPVWPYTMAVFCPVPATCPCNTCFSGWPLFLVPCSLHPACGPTCTLANSFLPALVAWWSGLGSPLF